MSFNDEYLLHLTTWGPHCGAPTAVFKGHLDALLRAATAEMAAKVKAAQEERDEAIRERDQARDAHSRTKAGWEHCRKAWKTESDRLHAALEAVEWAGSGFGGGIFAACPVCGNRKPNHWADCQLGAALDRQECRKEVPHG